ncbi:porin family protein [Flavobacteriaceae bacterium 3-367]|uniref:porin family protein n=1 Tax=Eudoraea algarum TaxID=3417568 RepID=UPI003281FA89
MYLSMLGQRMFLVLLVGSILCSNAQENEQTGLVDTSYLEDQFYIGLTYNFLSNKPDNVSERNLSYGLQLGFIKDMPINTRRNIALGLGLGYAVNSYYTNLLATESGDGFVYTILESGADFNRNKVETHLVEMPLEFRWRTSTPLDYKFWRVYTGVKLAYVVGGRSKFVSELQNTSFFNTDLRKFHYGLTLNFGYNTFNVHAYYALNKLFEDDVQITDGTAIEVRPLRIGIIFYIL